MKVIEENDFFRMSVKLGVLGRRCCFLTKANNKLLQATLNMLVIDFFFGNQNKCNGTGGALLGRRKEKMFVFSIRLTTTTAKEVAINRFFEIAL